MSEVWSGEELLSAVSLEGWSELSFCSLVPFLLLEGKDLLVVVKCSCFRKYMMSRVQAISNSNYRVLFNLFNFVFLLTMCFLMPENIFYFQNISCWHRWGFLKIHAMLYTLKFLEEIRISKNHNIQRQSPSALGNILVHTSLWILPTGLDMSTWRPHAIPWKYRHTHFLNGTIHAKCCRVCFSIQWYSRKINIFLSLHLDTLFR